MIMSNAGADEHQNLVRASAAAVVEGCSISDESLDEFAARASEALAKRGTCHQQ